MKLRFLDSSYSVCQLPPTSPLPQWSTQFFCVSRTDEELTIILESKSVPENVKAEHDFHCFRVCETLDFNEIGIIAGISQALARQQISILSISTYNTDYFLVPAKHRMQVIETLEGDGHEFI